MKIFISWSGPRSQYIAKALNDWLPKVIQAVDPWMSSEDIAVGTRWAAEISNNLSEIRVGIICLTPENQNNPWIMFEAGALSKTLQNTFVCPYLMDISPSQLSSPLTQFQSVQADKDGTFKLLQTLNKALGEGSRITDSQLSESIDMWWSSLEKILEGAPNVNLSRVQKRSSDEILEEVVENTREQLRREEIRLEASNLRDQKFEEVMKKMSGFTAMVEPMLNTTYIEEMQKRTKQAGHMMDNLVKMKDFISKSNFDDGSSEDESVLSAFADMFMEKLNIDNMQVTSDEDDLSNLQELNQPSDASSMMALIKEMAQHNSNAKDRILKKPELD